MTDSSALLAHILSQTRQNIQFLVSQNQISHADGQIILGKLPTANDSSVLAISQQTQRLLLTPEDDEYEPSVTSMPEPPTAAASLVRRNIPPPPQRSSQARALWGYNEQGQDPNDLSFRAGEIIEIIAETNADWWTGRNNGRQGLFPSNYVEKINVGSPSPAPPVPSPGNYGSNEKLGPPMPYGQYQPPMGPPGGYQPSPPPGAYNPYLAPPGTMQQQPPQQQQVVEQPQPQQPPKKNRFGGMGNTLAQSAVGGVGFGAGSAVGSGIINAIF